MSRAPLERVVVAGGGQVALLAAVALKRALPRTDVAIAPAPVAANALADLAHTTLPSLARLHARIGIDEGGMIARAGASHRLATRYSGWGGGDWLIGYGAVAAAGFTARWAGEAAARDRAVAPTGVAAALAIEERFARPADDRAAPLADLDYALRFDPQAHVARLRSLAAHLGIGALTTLDADLTIDTRAGVADEWIDWQRQLPGRRIAIERQPPRLSVLDETIAAPGGYAMLSPGRDATRCVRVGFGDDAAGVAIAPGRVATAWTGRSIAIGDAAARFEPLGWCNLHLAVCQIELLLELLPGRVIDPLERAEYNRRAALLANRVRDFVAAHHALRLGLRRSDAVAHMLAEFARRDRIPHYEEDSVPRDLWMQLLAAVCPDHAASPCRQAMTQAQRNAAIDDHRRRCAAAVAAAEPYPQWLAREIGR